LQEGSVDTDSKSLRRDGFNFAEQRWNDMRPMLTEFENMEKEAQVEETKEKSKVSKKRN